MWSRQSRLVTARREMLRRVLEIHCQTQAIETHSNPFQRYLYNYHLSNALYRVPHTTHIVW
eukprot:COSAG01_NODE_16_length_40091_cov_15.728646_4_plen_61_part_00